MFGSGFKKFVTSIAQHFVPARESEKIEIRPQQKSNLSLEKQKKLEELYRQLLNNKELVASGKLQFIGLENIKKKMGSKWRNLSSFVYEITEEIITKHIEKTDLFFGYKEDSYLIIFSKASTEEAKIKTNAIADEIRLRLFTLDEDQLKKLEIRRTVEQIKATSFLEEQFPEMTRNISEDLLFKQKGKKISSLYSEKINVSAEDYKSDSAVQHVSVTSSDELNFIYIPLWEIKRAALTTYICLPQYIKTERKSFYAYYELYKGKTAEQKLQLDLQILNNVLSEISNMEKDGRKLYIGCPVRYETLYDYKNYEVYKKACEKIPDSKKEFLILVIITPENDLPIKDPYWFVTPLKEYCYDVFVEVPLRQDTNFQILKASGIDIVGIHLSNPNMSEQESISISNNFGSKAKYFKIQKTFALDVSTLSATTSLVCAGFDYVGGSAVHEDVAKPDNIHRYRYEDLLGEMIK